MARDGSQAPKSSERVKSERTKSIAAHTAGLLLAIIAAWIAWLFWGAH